MYYENETSIFNISDPASTLYNYAMNNPPRIIR